MLAREKYANELIDYLLLSINSIAIDITTKNITDCSNVLCKKCLFRDSDNCLIAKQQYFNSEYVEPPLLSDEEYIILKNISKEYKYIVRDADTQLYLRDTKPFEVNTYWSGINCDSLCMFNHLFKFIKFEDKNPYLIENLLKDYEEKKGKRK